MSAALHVVARLVGAALERAELVRAEATTTEARRLIQVAREQLARAGDVLAELQRRTGGDVPPAGRGRSRFMRPWTPDYAEAVAALERLRDLHGLNTALRAVGDALSETIREAFLRRTGLVRANGGADARRLLGRVPRDVAPVRLGVDHEDAFRRPRTRAVDLVIGQPYSLEWSSLQRLVDHCRELGLEARVTGESWHFPRWTVLVEIRRQGEGQSGVAGVVL